MHKDKSDLIMQLWYTHHTFWMKTLFLHIIQYMYNSKSHKFYFIFVINLVVWYVVTNRVFMYHVHFVKTMLQWIKRWKLVKNLYCTCWNNGHLCLYVQNTKQLSHYLAYAYIATDCCLVFRILGIKTKMAEISTTTHFSAKNWYVVYCVLSL